MENRPTKNHTEINEILASLGAGSKDTWVKIAILLQQVELSGYWQYDYSSFSAWLHDAANILNLKVSLLWRYRRAATFYNKFYQNQIIPKMICLPTLEHLSDVSPDNIDILEKLSRVMPEKELIDLAIKVVAKQVGRRELLEKWQTLRVALDGRTARGKGVATPTLSKTDLEKGDVYIKDKVLNILQNSAAQYLEIETACSYSVMRAISLKKLKQSRVDALIMVRKVDSDEIEFHGVHIVTGNKHSVMKPSQLPSEECFDFTWLAFVAMPSENEIANVPNNFGILCFSEENYSTIRKACKSDKSGIEKAALMNALLNKFISF